MKEIIKNFKINGEFLSAKSFGNGHINDTNLVAFNDNGNEKLYILRKINKFVFTNPISVIQNTVNVIDHIRKKLAAEGIRHIDRKVLSLVKSNSEEYFFKDCKEDFWCTFNFIESAHTIDYVQSKEQAFQAAQAFGLFQKQLIDLDHNLIQDTIPNFHNIENRFDALNEAIRSDRFKRFKYCVDEVEKVNNYSNLLKELFNLVNSGSLPLRITHNDTKVNNVMIDDLTDKSLCIIDLDTVMIGTVLNDFGDMVRTATSPVAEDEQDISKVKMRIDVFDELAHGYLSELKDVLTEQEINHLVLGAKLITYEQAIRFLTDFLLNDVYYATEYEYHNLVRAKNQLALLDSIVDQSDQMIEIIEKYSSTNFN